MFILAKIYQQSQLKFFSSKFINFKKCQLNLPIKNKIKNSRIYLTQNLKIKISLDTFFILVTK